MAEVTMDEDVRHGKPVIEGTRITVDEVLGMLEGGMTQEEIEEEYGLDEEQVKSAIKYAASVIQKEEVHKIPART